jgi:hypothetical protein
MINSLEITNFSIDPVWKIANSKFLPFYIKEDSLSSEAKEFIHKVRKLNLLESIYLRGSLIENKQPFWKSDIDIFVISKGSVNNEINRQICALSVRELDIKMINAEYLKTDLVFYALLAHRSMHINGEKINLEFLPTNREFAWHHWVKYFPSGLPNEFDCSQRVSVIYFKQLIRCFGVIMFLEQNKFTRDINSCIDYSLSIDPEVYLILTSMKKSIEENEKKNYDIKQIKKLLINLFDNNFKHYRERI